jgi:hypothetical protein
MRALSAKFILWALQEGRPHNPLRELLRFYIKEQSMWKWGTGDYTWVFLGLTNTREKGSAVWSNICKSWLNSKQNLLTLALANMEEWRNLPLWHPHRAHKEAKLVGCSTNPQRQIKRRGILTVKDVLDGDDNLIPWEAGPTQTFPRSCTFFILKYFAHSSY